MSPVEAGLLVAAAAGLALALRTRRAVLRLDPLPGLEAENTPGSLPAATIVAAARDEERGIEAAVLSWLAQESAVQVVVVDDRSRDRTPEILAALAARDRRLEILRIDDRPAGWLGKCWALQQGARTARGEFILFTDADVELAPRALARALAECGRTRADHLALVPRIDTDHLLQWCVTASFFNVLLLVLRADLANSDDSRCLLGVGAFNLVRRSTYERVGGHEEIRMQVGDDVALSRLMARAGARRRFVTGLDAARVHWQRGGVLATVKGLEKNAFWAARLSPPAILAATAGTLLLMSPLAGGFVGGWGWVAFAAWWVAAALPHLAARHEPGRAAAAIAAQPWSAIVLLAAAWNSMVATLRRGGMTWRGDFFPLAEIRAAQKPLSWWGVGEGDAREAGGESPVA